MILKIGKDSIFIYVRDIDTNSISSKMLIHYSMDAQIIIKKVLEYCTNKALILVDKGIVYRSII